MTFNPATPLAIPDVAPAVIDALDHAGIGFVVTMEKAGAGHSVRRYVSRAAATILGKPVEELLGKPPMLDIAPEERPAMEARRQARLRGDIIPDRFETVVVHPDGKRVAVEVGTSFLRLDGEGATIAFFVDISDRKRAEDKLRRSEARLRTLIEVAPEGVSMLRDQRIVYANAEMGRILGERPDDLIGRSASQQVHADDLATLAARVGTMVASGAPLGLQEYRTRHKLGHWVTLEVASAPLDLEEGRAVVGFFRDVTDRKRLQAQLLEADRLATVGMLAAGVAHEINNPLAYVLLNLQRLAREIPAIGSDAERLATAMERVNEAREGAERVALIVRDLLAFARTEDGLGPVDVRAALDGAIKMATSELRYRAKLVTDYDHDLPAVYANEARLGQVFLNLLVNAAQALGAEGYDANEVRVAARCAPPISDGGPARVIVEVSDNGPGIAPELQARIFDPFFTTKPRGVGTGLGLSICHSIVTAFGGELTLEGGAAGRGATFRVALPVAVVPAKATATTPGGP